MIAKFINHLKKAERGQSIIILAFAFVALLGFVGLTTDVSLMFVRYATIRRAVDSASIAAATQIKTGTNEGAIQMAAKQFVEFHGLDAVTVKVETCQSLNQGQGQPEDEHLAGDRASEELVAELCTADQRKLVKVTVQAESPTAFLKLVGWNNFTLQASAISETAALDVVLIMDVSESMLTDTNYDDWARIGMGWAYKPPHIANEIAVAKSKDPAVYWEEDILASPQSEVNARLVYNDTDHAAVDSTTGDDSDYEVTVMDLDDLSVYNPEHGFPADASEFIPREPCRVRFNPSDSKRPSQHFPGRVNRDDETDTIYLDDTDPAGGLYGEFGQAWQHGDFFGGFVPTYNYYGCCNDPGTHSFMGEKPGYAEMLNNSADFDFTDLICQPFKGARDAVELFLDKIDFIRGDRVAFVTFDRTAFLINPWNETGQAAGGSHMLDSYDTALNTLRRVIGIRAEPNFYVWDDTLDPGTAKINAGWSALAAGIRRDADGIAGSIPINFDSPDGSGTYYGHLPNTGFDYVAGADILNNYPVKDNCALSNSMLPKPYSVDGVTLAEVSLPYPSNRDQLGNAQSWSSFKPPLVNVKFQDLPDQAITAFSYEKWAGCRGTNIGAALREANNALLDPNTSRRFGTIWVMVLLGDGAAGASDPVRRNETKLAETQPYFTDAAGDIKPQEGDYGAFGVCPYGVPNDSNLIGEVVKLYGGVPFCLDKDPVSRHSCDFRPDDKAVPDPITGRKPMEDDEYVRYPDTVPLDPPLVGVTGPKTADTEIQWNQDRGNLFDLDIGDDCDDILYDVDDYARDWADFIALQKDDAAGDELLPTIYTIGFGLTFDAYPDVTEDLYHGDLINDYLGEQMLRYIADVGDNNQLDNDYYQHYDEDNSVNDPKALVKVVNGVDVYEYGVRGACQYSDDDYDDISTKGYDDDLSTNFDGLELEKIYAPLDPKVDCGNYFNAPSADRLEFVFDLIASKLFTRLTG
jgi:Flp pilus assembly protein TadG